MASSRVQRDPNAPCIYCRGPVGARSREHVIPRAFGTFGHDTPILECVCVACNNYFSREFEQSVTRGGPEAIERYRHKLKPMAQRNELDGERVKLIARSGTLEGLRLDPLTKEIEPQVVLRQKVEGRWTSLALEDLKQLRPEQFQERYEVSPPGMKLFLSDDSQFSTFQAEFRRLGFEIHKSDRFRKIPITPGQKIPSTYQFTLNHQTGRLMAKIAMNYLALVCSSEFVLRPDFDQVRNFIRRAETPAYRCVHLLGEPHFVREEQPSEPVAHFLTLGLLHGGSTIHARVALFSGATYHVFLCKYFSGLLHPHPLVAGVGHHFDFTRRSVRPLPRQLLETWNYETDGTALAWMSTMGP